MKADTAWKMAKLVLYSAAYTAVIVGIMVASVPLWRWFINTMVVCK